MNPIIIEMVSDYVNQAFDLLTQKHVLFREGIVDKAPAGIESALKNMEGAGERIRMPLFTIGDDTWENVITPPTTAGTVAATPNQTTTYTSHGTAMADEYAIKVWRRLLYEYSTLNNQRRVWGKDAEQHIAEEFVNGITRRCFDLSLHSVLKGAIPTANFFDETSQNIGNQTAGSRTINPAAVVAATQAIGADNMDQFKVMIMHSKVWADYKRLAYTSTFSGATLLSNMATEQMSIWLCDNKIVYVTDRCNAETTGTGQSTYDTYLLAPKQLQLAIHEPFHLVKSEPSALHETMYVRANIGYIPHLKGMEYKSTAAVRPTETQLADRNNWQQGRETATTSILAGVIVTN